MKPFQPSPLGILSCNDLVQLYYGFPIRTQSRITQYAVSIDPVQILLPDPRRIYYGVSATFDLVVAPNVLTLGSLANLQAGGGQAVSVIISPGFVVERSFLAQMDAVTEALFAEFDAGNNTLSVREIFLTPPGVDIVPLPE